MGQAKNSRFNHQKKMDEFYFLFSNPRNLPCFWITDRLLREASVGWTEDTGIWAGTFVSATGSFPASRPPTWEQRQKEPSLICEKCNICVCVCVFKLSATNGPCLHPCNRSFTRTRTTFQSGNCVLWICLNPFITCCTHYFSYCLENK